MKTRTVLVGSSAALLLAFIVACNGAQYESGVPASAQPRRTTQATPQLFAPMLERLGPTPNADPDAAAGFVKSEPDRFAFTPAIYPGDELWIIEETARPTGAVPADEESPGSGALIATIPGEADGVPVPLKHTAVHARVQDYISTVDVVQTFHNPYAEKIEAVYVFPLPHDSAVRDFVITIGERKIRGIIREKEEARQIYTQARAQGYQAALLSQARPNIFEQSVANIEPGHEVDVNIRYFHTLAYAGGSYQFVFPMVVGPRFNPPCTTEGVGAVPVGQPGSSGQATEVAYLEPGQRSGDDISITVDVQAGAGIEAVDCISHEVDITRDSPSQSVVTLAREAVVPNRDFVLRFAVARTAVKTSVLTHQNELGGFFTMMVYPPAGLAELPRQPMEMIFVVDCSGSMNGVPLAQAKAAVRKALHRLGPRDSFQIIRFSSDASSLAPQPVAANEENVTRGLQYLASLSGGGGTMMIEGIKAALGFDHDPDKLRFVAFLTDGYIGNESEILTAVQQRLGSTRIFSLGVGSSVNRHLLEGLARIGRGAVAYILHDEDPGRAVDLLYDRITHPVLTDLEIDWGGTQVTDVLPSRLPDLFVGRPVVVTGRYRGDWGGSVRARGRAAGEEVLLTVIESVDRTESSALPAVWARRKIAALEDVALADVQQGRRGDEIRELALTFGLVSAYTSYVAVDASAPTAGGHGTTVQVPVPMPAGVRYRTTIRK